MARFRFILNGLNNKTQAFSRIGSFRKLRGKSRLINIQVFGSDKIRMGH